MLSDESRALAEKLAADHRLEQPPEALAVLNALDPVALPNLLKEEEASSLLQARTLKGGLMLIRMSRAEQKGPWRVDLTDQLKNLRRFLEAQKALDSIRDQAGEYAAFWKDFAGQAGRTVVSEAVQEPSPGRGAAGKDEKKKKKRP